jgi:hypothetical protein
MGLAPVAVLVPILLLRIGDEEKMMHQTFGAAWERYVEANAAFGGRGGYGPMSPKTPGNAARRGLLLAADIAQQYSEASPVEAVALGGWGLKLSFALSFSGGDGWSAISSSW